MLIRVHSCASVVVFAIAFISLCGAALGAQKSPAPATLAPADLSIRNELDRAIDKGVAWLAKNQDPKGFWSTPDHPAVTSLVLVALQKWLEDNKDPAVEKASAKGYEFLLTCVHEDGTIYGKKELINYNTSIGLLALTAARRPEFQPLILKARQYLIASQSDFGEPGKVDNTFDGGIGYGSRYQHSDMANTTQALEALYYSRNALNEKQLEETKDLNWAAVIQFIQKCQNLPSHNSESWVTGDPQNKGGFIYFPGNSMAGQTNLPSGRVALRSYGSISYAGLLSYIYAGLTPEDPRVKAVVDWLRQNFTLEENPGMGPQGLFYYYHTMAKALRIASLDTIETPEGGKVNWRKELGLKLLNLQKTDGSFANDNARWWEKDPALVTAYALQTLFLISAN